MYTAVVPGSFLAMIKSKVFAALILEKSYVAWYWQPGEAQTERTTYRTRVTNVLVQN